MVLYTRFELSWIAEQDLLSPDHAWAHSCVPLGLARGRNAVFTLAVCRQQEDRQYLTWHEADPHRQ